MEMALPKGAVAQRLEQGTHNSDSGFVRFILVFHFEPLGKNMEDSDTLRFAGFYTRFLGLR